MDARAILARVRDGCATPRDIAAFVTLMRRDDANDAQVGAFAMAVRLNGLGAGGRTALTTSMRDSGRVLSWDLPGPVVDKHSTGGIGDCVSLILAPLLAACDAFVPMVSGRGLGHSGGTLDKLEAVPGVDTAQDEASFRRIVATVGCAIVATTSDLAPADRRLYAIRDVTGCVDHIDLITASILSKKLAAGVGRLVLDVKTGSGAFLRDPSCAKALAQALVETAQGAGCRAVAHLTDMSQPLAPALGHAIEVRVAIDLLTGRADHPRLRTVTLALGVEALMLAGLSPDREEAAARMARALSSGRAAEQFRQMVAAMGGPGDVLERPLAQAPVQRAVMARRTGLLQSIDGQALGETVVALGGGRRQPGDRVDPAVGLDGVAPLGTCLGPDGPPLAIIHARSEGQADVAEASVRAAMHIGDAPIVPPLLLQDRIE